MDVILFGSLPGIEPLLGATGFSLYRVTQETLSSVAGRQSVLAVVAKENWPQWFAFSSNAKVPLPAAYVVSKATEPLDPNNLRDHIRQGAIGYGPDTEAVAADVITMAKRRAERLGVAREESKNSLTVGSVLLRRADQTRDPVLVGHAVGPMAQLLMSLEGTLKTLRPFDYDGEWPFDPATMPRPVEWLDLYHFHLVGGPPEKQDSIDKTLARIRERAALRGSPPGAHAGDPNLSGKARKRKDGDAPEVAKPQFISGSFASLKTLCETFEQYFMREQVLPSPILLCGETGTGKTILAKRVHSRLTDLAGGRKVAYQHVNCSALGNMAAVELFGAMAGAYTPLTNTNPGKIFASYGGVLFLDEFSRLSPDVQAKLLLFLEDGTVNPMAWVGDPIRVPVQIVAATNEHLPHLVADGKFQADLFHRFRGRTLTLPPIRELKHDLPYLVDYILQDEEVNSKVEGKVPGEDERKITSVTTKALKALEDHDYPGNFRELQQVLSAAAERAIEAGSRRITSRDIVFQDSTLPRQDSVLAVFVRMPRAGSDGTSGPPEILLRWNPRWRDYFLPSGRVENETYEACLRRELGQKLGLEPSDYTSLRTIPHQQLVRLIHYSTREHRRKHYHFHLFHVTLTKQAEEQKLCGEGMQWVSLERIEREAGSNELSGTLRYLLDPLRAVLRPVAEPPVRLAELGTASDGSPAEPPASQGRGPHDGRV